MHFLINTFGDSSPNSPGKPAVITCVLLLLGLAWYWFALLPMLEAHAQQDTRLHIVRFNNQIPLLLEADHHQAGEFLLAVKRILPAIAQLESPRYASLLSELRRLELGLSEGFYLPKYYLSTMQVYRGLIAEILQKSASEMSTGTAPGTYLLVFLGLLVPAGFVWSSNNLPTRIKDNEHIEALFKKLGRASVNQNLFDEFPLAITLSDAAGRIVAANKAYYQISGFSHGDVIGQHCNFDSAEFQNDEFYQGIDQQLDLSGVWQGEIKQRDNKGNTLVEEITRAKLCDAAGAKVGQISICLDGSRARRVEQLLLWQSRHDGLTKFPNRLCFLEFVEEEIQKIKAARHSDNADASVQCAVLNIELDGFRRVNGSLGRTIGDRVISEAAFRLAMCVSDEDKVARIGGNEFAVLLKNVASPLSVRSVAIEILHNIEQVFALEACDIFISASMGIALIPENGMDASSVLQCAEVARACSKDEGGNSLTYFQPEFNIQQRRRIEVESHLRIALKENQLELYFQPIIDYPNGRVMSAEALLRWDHPEWGMVSPAEFIPVAEQSGLILDIGYWVVKGAIARINDWLELAKQNSDRTLDGFRVAINISARQLQTQSDRDGLFELLQQAPCGHLTIEVTESVLVGDHKGVTEFFARVQKAGIHIALDDFGTGYSSLSYLREFKFDTLKIDKSFVDHIDSSNKDLGLIASLVSMGKILGLDVVVEGVETESQLILLSQVGSKFIQGYYFAKPMPVDEFVRYRTSATIPKKGEHIANRQEM